MIKSPQRWLWRAELSREDRQSENTREDGCRCAEYMTIMHGLASFGANQGKRRLPMRPSASVCRSCRSKLIPAARSQRSQLLGARASSLCTSTCRQIPMVHSVAPVAASAVGFGGLHLCLRHGSCYHSFERMYAGRKHRGLLGPQAEPSTLASQAQFRVFNEIHNLLAV